MDIFTKIREFRKDKQKSGSLNMTYRIDDCDLIGLAKKISGLDLFLSVHQSLASNYIKMYEENEDIYFFKGLV